ncbi:hypothetical protein T265_08196 [Opisthorchis viverrini]|uniref:Uncharacterized protein n=1 Tax=Opisthorchis viverrini TaxID=6198 RepID=A0A075A968_OPIVI|nr:hypothetical protein T265_08196 [Opisthorchis viverrini]KER24064.1 hypothetical protein T265_08196 [Opisthorchis viverrini]
MDSYVDKPTTGFTTVTRTSHQLVQSEAGNEARLPESETLPEGTDSTHQVQSEFHAQQVHFTLGTKSKIKGSYDKENNLFRENRPSSKLSAVTSFRCTAALAPEESTRTEILPNHPKLDRSSQDPEVRFEPRTLR